MKIIQIAPIWEKVPPKKYGGVELIVSNITEELIKKGHEVVLFATGDSKTRAKLFSVYPHSLCDSSITENKYYELLEIAQAVEFAEKQKFDIIHSHLLNTGLVFSKISKIPMIFTLHGDLDTEQNIPGQKEILSNYKDANFVSISNKQRNGASELNYIDTIYNGIDLNFFDFNKKPKDKYLIFLGRISDKKGPIEAIQIAQKAGVKLKIAAKIDENKKEFYNSKIKPQIDGKQIEFIGEVNPKERNQLLKNALCLLNPIKWEEPFGLVMIEAMACGTPVIAFDRGSVSEIIKDGETGFIIKSGDINGMAKAVRKIQEMSDSEYGKMRQNCRKHIEDNFSIEKMVSGYEKVYQKIIAQK